MLIKRHNNIPADAPGTGVIIGFDNLIGQQRQIRLLTTAMDKNSVPHALLFTGEDGIGKKTTALNFAMALNCRGNAIPGNGDPYKEARPCGTCRSCRKIMTENHPDIHLIEPTGVAIRIDQIRNLCGVLTLKPYEGAVRVVLISDAHTMNAEAGNALLKVLEEPPGDTVFILTAPQTADLLPTLVSRCQHIRFNPISQNQLETYLVENVGLDPENAMIVASLAGGSIGRALCLQNENWIGLRNWIIDEIESIERRQIGFSLAFAEILSGDKDRLRYAFEIMKHWFRDLAVVKYDPAKLYNRDLRTRLETAAKRYTLESMIEKTNAIEASQRAIAGNANARLALDAMMLTLQNNPEL